MNTNRVTAETFYPLFVEGMTKEQIRHKYRYESLISYDHAIELLIRLGFTDFSADKYLFDI